jgi:hypothetical protein
MKITKTKLKQIVKEEFEAVTVDESFMSGLKKGFKKMTGSHARELSAYDPWAEPDIANGWKTTTALLDKIYQEDAEDEYDVEEAAGDLSQSAQRFAELLEREQHGTEKYAAPLYNWLVQASEVYDIDGLRNLGEERVVKNIRRSILKAYEAATGQGGSPVGGEKDFLSILSGELRSAEMGKMSIYSVIKRYASLAEMLQMARISENKQRKITKTKLNLIIKEEINAVMLDESFFSGLKRGFKKVTGSHGAELKQLDPWGHEHFAGGWAGMLAVLQAIKDQRIHVRGFSKATADLNEKAAALAPHVKKAGGRYTAKFLTNLSKANETSRLRIAMGENLVSLVRTEVKEMYEAATGQGDKKGEQNAKDFLNALSGLDYNGQPVSELQWGGNTGLVGIVGAVMSILSFANVDVQEITKAGETMKKIKSEFEAAKEELARYWPSEEEQERFMNWVKEDRILRQQYRKPPLAGGAIGRNAEIWLRSGAVGKKYRKVSEQFRNASKAISDAVAGFNK